MNGGSLLSLLSLSALYDSCVVPYCRCHIAVTYDSEGERLNIYLMGQRSGSMSSQVAEGKVGTDQPVYIGTWHRDGKVGRKFSGMLRELRFWDSARTANQMVESMFGLSADELADDSLKGYWPLSGGTERSTHMQTLTLSSAHAHNPSNRAVHTQPLRLSSPCSLSYAAWQVYSGLVKESESWDGARRRFLGMDRWRGWRG